MRHIFIGDIHGCFDEFQRLLLKLKISNSDKIYLVGDMINRGPKSIEIIEYIYQNRENIFAIKGNHEVGFIEYFYGRKPEFENPEYIILKKYFIENPHVFEFFESLPLYIDENEFRCVHAGIIPGISLENQDPQVLTEIYFYKELPWYFSYSSSEKLLIYGHWAGDGLHIRENTIGLDTGCVIGKKLSAYILEEDRIVQVHSAQQYFTPKNWGYNAELSKKGIYN